MSAGSKLFLATSRACFRIGTGAGGVVELHNMGIDRESFDVARSSRVGVPWAAGACGLFLGVNFKFGRLLVDGCTC